MQCPNCGIEMDEVRKVDVLIDACSKCGGIWLDRGELDKLKSAWTEAFADTSADSHAFDGGIADSSHEHDRRDDRHGHHGDSHGHDDRYGGHRKSKREGLMGFFEGFGGD